MAKKEKQIEEKYSWHSAKLENVYKKVGFSEKGLSSEEAKLRLEKNGPNLLPQKRSTPFIVMLLKEFIRIMP